MSTLISIPGVSQSIDSVQHPVEMRETLLAQMQAEVASIVSEEHQKDYELQEKMFLARDSCKAIDTKHQVWNMAHKLSWGAGLCGLILGTLALIFPDFIGSANAALCASVFLFLIAFQGLLVGILTRTYLSTVRDVEIREKTGFSRREIIRSRLPEYTLNSSEHHLSVVQQTAQKMVHTRAAGAVRATVQDAYELSLLSQKMPAVLQGLTQSISDTVMTALVAGSLMEEIDRYKGSRWASESADESLSPTLAKAIKAQLDLETDLDDYQRRLEITVKENAVSVSLLRGEILRLRSQEVIESGEQNELLSRRQELEARREALDELNSLTETKLLTAGHYS